jgi:hypothetical protein
MVEKYKSMFENTKKALLTAIIKSTVCVDPAPLPGSGSFNIIKAMKRDIQKALKREKQKIMKRFLNY